MNVQANGALRATVIVVITLTLSRTSNAGVTEFTNKALWQSTAGAFSTIGFTEYPDGTPITDQYSEQGALFTNSFDFIHDSSAYLNDGVGLVGAGGTIVVAFDTPMTSIAADYPGILTFKLYDAGSLIYTSSSFSNSISHFAGLISTQSFDTAVLYRESGGGVYIDDLHFGPPVPAPSALGLLAAGGLVSRSRRRR